MARCLGAILALLLLAPCALALSVVRNRPHVWQPLSHDPLSDCREEWFEGAPGVPPTAAASLSFSRAPRAAVKRRARRAAPPTAAAASLSNTRALLY